MRILLELLIYVLEVYAYRYIGKQKIIEKGFSEN